MMNHKNKDQRRIIEKNITEHKGKYPERWGITVLDGTGEER